MIRKYCDVCGRETNDGESLRFELSGYAATKNEMRMLDLHIDVCPDCAKNYAGTTVGMLSVEGKGETMRLILDREKRPA